MIARLNQHLQDSFLLLAITDTGFLKLVVGRVPPEYFTSEMTEDIAVLCFDHYKEFNEAPGDHFHDEFVRLLHGLPDDRQAEHVAYVKKLRGLPSPNRQYVLNRVGDFVKTRKREVALIAAADLLHAGKLEDHDNLLYETLRSGIPEEDAGINYYTDTGYMGRERDEELMPTGIPMLTGMIGGFKRGQLISIFGGMKGGKSWQLAGIVAKPALFRGLRVCHISHEVSQQEQETRYDMMFSGCGSKKEFIGSAVKYWRWDKKNQEAFPREVHVKSVHDNRIVARARKRMARFGGELRIKKYPMGQCTTAETERYLNYLEAYEGFVPDVLIIDYLDIMNLECYGTELRHQLNSAYKWAKGMADERNILVATASQVVRASLDRQRLGRKDAAEDIRKIANVDLALAIGRSPDQVKNGLATVSVVANRDGQQDICTTISMCYAIGQTCIASTYGDKDFGAAIDEWRAYNEGDGDGEGNDDAEKVKQKQIARGRKR